MNRAGSIAVFFLALAAIPVFAEDYREVAAHFEKTNLESAHGISIGETGHFKVLLSQGVHYDSNIFLTGDNRKHDLISIFSPGFLLDLPMGNEENHVLQGRYTADIARFSNHKDQDYINQDFFIKGRFRLPSGYLRLQNEFKDTVDRVDTEFIDPLRRRENTGGFAWGLELNRLTCEAAYTGFVRKYTERVYRSLDYTEDLFSGTLFYRVAPKTLSLLEVDHGLIDYPRDNTRAGVYDQVRAGLTGELTARFTGHFKAGYQDREYDSAQRAGFSGFVSEAGFKYDLSELTEFVLRAGRSAVESITSGNNYYDQNIFSASVARTFLSNYTLVWTTQLSRRAYPQEDLSVRIRRRDDVFSHELGVRYDSHKFLRVRAGYQFLDDDSNIEAHSYRDHIISLRFDFLI